MNNNFKTNRIQVPEIPILKIPELIFETKETTKNNIPEKYIINQKCTVLMWKDGTKTIVKRKYGDKFDKRIAFLTAYFQKHSGLSKTKANKYLDHIFTEEELKFEELLLKDAKTGKKIKVQNIKIPKNYKKPSNKKLMQKLEYFEKHKQFESRIIIDSNDVLVDGYTSYLIAIIYRIKELIVEVKE